MLPPANDLPYKIRIKNVPENNQEGGQRLTD
jgi:hypothetical protein